VALRLEDIEVSQVKISNKFHNFGVELKSYSSQEKQFLLLAVLCGFFINVEYGITKLSSTSIFLDRYDAKLSPYAWLAAVPLNFLIIKLYNRFLTVLGPFRIFLYTIYVTVCINILSALFAKTFPPFAFVLFVWKDSYILLLVQQLTSVVQTNTSTHRSRYLYGLLFGCCGMGAIVGALFPSFLAVKIGTEKLLYMTVPLHMTFAFLYFHVLKKGGIVDPSRLQIQNGKGGFHLLFSSRTLKFILTIVILMQLAVTVIDQQFNVFMQMRFPDQDLRTQFSGRFYLIVNSGIFCLQLFGTYIVVQLIGLSWTHIMVPGILLLNAVCALFYPVFGVIAYGMGMIKTFDYSIFSILKELLYTPLKLEAKFHAKAIIDIFVFRSAKALASFFVLGIQFFWPLRAPYIYSFCPFCFLLVWMVTAFFFFRTGKEEALLEVSA